MTKKVKETEQWISVDSAFPEVWKADDDGDEFQGTLVRIRRGKFGQVYVVRTTDGKIYSLPNHAQLVSLLELAELRPGYRVLIVCNHIGSAKRGDYFEYELKYQKGRLVPDDSDIPF